MSVLEKARENLRRWRADPVAFVREQFRVEPDPWQRQALEAFASEDPQKKRISLQACAGPGKSAALCWCGWNFLSCYGGVGDHPKAAAVSISSDNLKDNLWAEFAKWQTRSPFLSTAFNWSNSRICAVDYPSTWFLSARSFAKTANLEEVGRTLSGLHSGYVLYLIDESGDIPPAIIKSAEQGLSTGPKFGKILQAGNPTSHSGMLYAAATNLAHQWQVIRITGDPDDPNRSTRIDIDWAREQIKTWGRDNPWVMAYILGVFPPSALNAMLGPDEVRAAMARNPAEDTYDWAARVIGVDVARFGDDSTVLFPRQGLASFQPVIMRGARTNEIGARAAVAWHKWKADAIFVDDTGGFGNGVVDSLLQHGLAPIPINFSSKADDPHYFNKRAEMWMRMADWVKRGGALPRIESLVRELTTPTYTLKHGQFQVEEKEQIKKRLGFSPDMADALALTFANEIAPRPRLPDGRMAPERGQQADGYVPFADADGDAYLD